MNIHFQDTVPADFHDSSRVWIYQANRPFTMDEVLRLEELLEDFASHWLSHGAPVKGYGDVLFGQFILIMADEQATGVSGCSTDSSVRLIKNIEQDFNVELFNRQLLAFIVHERIQLVPLAEFERAVEEGMVNAATMYFNNTVLDKRELVEKWIVPVSESWLGRRLIAKQV